MEEMRRNVWVGLFVLCGVIALGTLVVLFGRGPTALMPGGTYPLIVHFDRVTAIREGNMVTVNGIDVGRVAAVGLVDPGQFEAGVNVRIAVDEQYIIREGTRALATEPVLGQGRPPIELLPGLPGAEPLKPGAVIPGDVRGAIDSIFPPGVVSTFETAARQIGDAAEDLSPVLQNLEKLLASRAPEDADRAGLPGNLTTAVARLDASLKHFNEVLGDPDVKSKVRETVANVHAMSVRGEKMMTELEGVASDGRAMMSDARQLVGKVDRSVDNLDARVNEATRALVESLDKVSTFLDHLNVVATQVRRGEGNLGQLVMDDKLYESLLISVERLSQSLEELRALIKEWREGKVKVGL